MSELPTGTVTFLFTDIEGSTRLLQELGEDYPALLEEHARLIRDTIEPHGGVDVSTEGDAFFCVFRSAPEAVSAAVGAQRALAGHDWPGNADVRVRMGLHTGTGTLGGDNYVGLDVHRAARVASAGHGGQVLVTEPTKALVEHGLPDGVALRDLGLHHLKDLAHAEHVYQVESEGLRSDFPPIRSVESVPNNLPAQLTSFVGREPLVSSVTELLGQVRLLTLTGPGGTGKTRLSLRVAAEMIDHFPDGVFFVPLATITEPELIPSAIVKALELPTTGGDPMERLFGFLQEKRLLLVLDNFEQVLDGATNVAELLRCSEHLKVLVTSRAPLRISGEQEMPVPPLGVPVGAIPSSQLEEYEAVKLFVERARATRPDFTVSEENASAVAAITSRLDGLPLAIELAAARVKVLPPAAILERLENSLSILSGGGRDLPTRQQTLRDAIAWSYELLDEQGRRLFERMSVFSGGATLEDAEAVVAEGLEADVLDGLGMLVDQSLLRQEDRSGRARFTMLETIREFAGEKLAERGEAQGLKDRHAAVYLALAEEAEPHLLSINQKVWLDRLDDEIANIRSAFAWSLEEADVETALCFAASLWRFAQMRGYLHEGRSRTEEALARPGGSHRSRARAREAAGGLAYWMADFDAANEHYRAALERYEELGDQEGKARILYSVSYTYELKESPEPAMAEAVLDEAEEIYERLDDRAGLGRILWARATLDFWRSRYEESLGFHDRAISILREVGTPFDLGWALYTMAGAAQEIDDLDTARQALREGLQLFAEARDVSAIVLFLSAFAKLAIAEGALERAVRLGGAMTAFQKASGTDLVERSTGAVTDLGEVLDQLGDKSLPVLEEGAAMSLDQAVRYALSEQPVSA